MPNISSQQLAELLIGVARAQAAVIQGIESAMPGTSSTHISPTLQNVAHLRDRPEPSLVDLPVRVLLSSLGRVPPDPANIARDLDRLLGDAASAPAAPAGNGGGGEELDFSSKS